MFTRILTIEDLKRLFAEVFFTKTDKVTKISDGSVMNGFAYGIAKVGQKVNKDVALVESHLFPEQAYGQYLDNIARDRGVASRFGASGSSGYLRLVGDPGTVYLRDTHTFTGQDGIVFELEDDTTIPQQGYIYSKVKSQQTGSNTNVAPGAITDISENLVGHDYVINEYYMLGGRDVESDDLFRNRIREGPNILAKNTLEMIRQVFLKINPDILRVDFLGSNESGKPTIAVLKQNGVDLTPAEKDELYDQAVEFLPLSDLKPFWKNNPPVEIVDFNVKPVFVSVRLEIDDGFDVEDVRKDMQILMAKRLDLRFWRLGSKVEWDDLLVAAKQTRGVKYIYDNFFFPRVDMPTEFNEIPRIQGFVLLDKEGRVLSGTAGTFDPVFYPAQADFSFQQTVLKRV